MPMNKALKKVWIKWYDEATESIKEEECYFHLFFPGKGSKPSFFTFRRNGNGGWFKVNVDDLWVIKFLSA